MIEPSPHLSRFRWTVSLFIVGLVLSGVTAFPLQTELSLLVHWLGIDRSHPPGMGMAHWIATVDSGLVATYAAYPWLAYGTDWLAFGHIAIGVFFIGAWVRPLESEMILKAGIACCILVIPTALICGAVRGIPFGWRLIDCSFGVLALPFLFHALSLLRQMKAEPRLRAH